MPDVKRHISVGEGPVGDEHLHRMMALDGASMNFSVTRTPQKGRTFSAEGFDTMTQLMHAWAVSRAFRDLNAKKKSPGHKVLKVTLTVTVE